MNDPRPSCRPPERSSEERWDAALTELEAVIARQRTMLAAGDLADGDSAPGGSGRHAFHGAGLPLFSPPADLPALPAAFEARAGRLLGETRELVERARSMSERLRPAGPAVHQPLVRRAAATFDRRV